MIRLKSLIDEAFETPSGVVSDPSYNKKNLNDILRDFKKAGGKILGQGHSGIALHHPKWKYVLKLFFNDVPYLKFVRFVLQNPRPSFPVFYDKPRKIIPNFTRERNEQFLYIVKMELLYSISKEEYNDIDFYLYYGLLNFDEHPKTHIWLETKKKIDIINKKYPNIKRFAEDYNFLLENAKIGVPDRSQNNIMKRSNGQFVISDPFWEGETPYQTYDRLMRAEIDYDYEVRTPQLPGGQRYKKSKPIKMPTPKKSIPGDENDIPFE